MIDQNEPPDRIVPALSRGGARRRRVEGGRQRAVKVRFTDAEYAAITARAAESGVSVQWLLVAGALTRKPTSAAPSALTAELAGLRRLVANIANNINQIVRKLNSCGRPDASIAPAADAVRRTMRRLDAVIDAAARAGLLEQTIRGLDRSGPEAESGQEQASSPRMIRPPQRNAPGTPG
ncbi:MAG TPA: plasmid mobilization relaxosome protein MobC [Streptosporangiaceae bacterium]|nr:plasmid mobilization relaxosome protein MobC [Streptosporangiaceae bacterium]